MAGRKALVLGGGGVTGTTWELGLLAGLAEAGRAQAKSVVERVAEAWT